MTTNSDEQWKFNEWVTELADPFWLKDAQKEGEFFDANGFARALLSASKPAAPIKPYGWAGAGNYWTADELTAKQVGIRTETPMVPAYAEPVDPAAPAQSDVCECGYSVETSCNVLDPTCRRYTAQPSPTAVVPDDDLPWQDTFDGLLAYVLQDELHNRLTPRIIDIAYTAFMSRATGKNSDDGGPCDWFNDTKPIVQAAIAKLRKDLSESRAAASLQPVAQPVEQTRALPLNFENRLTPYGMLVRALRIVADTTLYDMAKHLSSTPATLSSVEFGRKPLTDAMVADTAAYFSGLGIPDTLHALKIAARPASGGVL